jgi:hypothetical protein
MLRIFRLTVPRLAISEPCLLFANQLQCLDPRHRHIRKYDCLRTPMRRKITNETWDQIKTGYAAGINLRELARK